MNEVIKQLRERKSCRIFEKKEVQFEIRNEIIKSALEAPTAGAMMLYTIIDVTDTEKKKKLSVTCDNQPFIADAPLVLVFLADWQRWFDAFGYEGCEPRRPGTGDILLACADAIVAAQNTVVAANSLGLGSCYIGDIIENCEDVREILGLPEYVIPAAMVVYGYPSESQLRRKKPERFSVEHIVHQNSYRRLSVDEHKSMQEDLNIRSGFPDKDITESVRALCRRKYMSDFSLEMNRSARVYLDSFDHSIKK
ncbi:nitroreductase family protein [Youngiibacter multivorans]|uniref:Nitroreductase n=1 Tax=Youngiibacter multivorans TaxID=937251 RepID=A0ABS4FZ61_9CLOT|nr:nitroreductase family protein [Youngiibacter multivorans]MBP1917595.1 nitroreductase [Youngiibacter multivorans]